MNTIKEGQNDEQKRQKMTFNVRHVAKSLKEVMQRIHFKLIQEIQQYSMIFQSRDSRTLQLKTFKQYTYKVSWETIFYTQAQYLGYKIKITQLKDSQNRDIFSHYQLLGDLYLNQINNQNFQDKKVYFDYSTRSLNILVACGYVLYMILPNKIVNTWKQVKIEVIEKLIINFKQCQRLVLQERKRLQLIQQKFQQNKSFVNNNSNKPVQNQKLKAHKQILSEVQKTILFQKEQIAQNINYKQMGMQIDLQIQKCIKGVKLFQQNTFQNNNQFKYSIYDKAFGLIDNWQDKPNQSLKKNQTNTICQGIERLRLTEWDKNYKLTTSTKLNLSTVQIQNYQFKYEISVHNHLPSSSNCQKNHQSQNLANKLYSQQMSCQDSNQKQQPGQRNTKKNVQQYQKVILKLASKSCLKKQQNKVYTEWELKRIKDSEDSFLNEYNFIKNFRDKVFPYIMRYFLQVMNSDENSQTSSQLKNKYILEKKIYMKAYPFSLSYLLSPHENDINKYFTPGNVQKILRYLFQIASTLRFLDRLQIIHRDIKPSNIMIDQYSNIRFIDWGSYSIRENYKPIAGTDSSQNNLNSNQKCKKQKKQKKQTVISQNKSQRLLTTQKWSQSSHQIKTQSKQLFLQLFGNKNNTEITNQTQINFQNNYFFDVYSFGRIVEAFEAIILSKFNWNSNFWLLPHIGYLKKICLQLNPYERLCPLEILIYLSELIKILKKKKQLIASGQK